MMMMMMISIYLIDHRRSSDNGQANLWHMKRAAKVLITASCGVILWACPYVSHASIDRER